MKSVWSSHIGEMVRNLVRHIWNEFVEVVERSINVDYMGPFLLLSVWSLVSSHRLGGLQVRPLDTFSKRIRESE